MRGNVLRKVVPGVATLAVASVGVVGLASSQSDASIKTQFDMVRSTAAVKAGCLPDAKAQVRVEQRTRTSR